MEVATANPPPPPHPPPPPPPPSGGGGSGGGGGGGQVGQKRRPLVFSLSRAQKMTPMGIYPGGVGLLVNTNFAAGGMGIPGVLLVNMKDLTGGRGQPPQILTKHFSS